MKINWSASVLLIAGLFLAVPALYNWLSMLTFNVPWIQTAIGIIALIISFSILFRK